MTIVKNRFVRILLLVSGWFFIGLALAGAIIPLVPTTPFLLIAAACFYRSSSRFYQWLMNNKLFGQYIRDYKEKKGVPLNVKLVTLIFLWSSILVSAFILVPILWLQILLIAIAVAVTIHIALIKTKR
ncbi:MAG: YbaN family protein [Bacteroidales bacterium]|nr:YbaN family protein [Bacteroidota bacterium]MBL6950206.1 YbaN family protein [Bacteroidales bacterium]